MTDPAAIAAVLMKAGRGADLTTTWDSFCDCDPLPEGVDHDLYVQRLEDEGLLEWRSVDDDDLEDAFAEERGIVPGGMVYSLTPLGLAVRASLASTVREGEGESPANQSETGERR